MQERPACRAASHVGLDPEARRRAGRVNDGFVSAARCHGQCIALWQFSKYSLVVTMITVGISTGYLWGRTASLSLKGPCPAGGGGMSLFWRVFTANAALLVAAALVLGVSPVTVSWPIAVTEAVVLGLGLAGMLAANAVLLRLAFAPLTALAARMTQVDLLEQPDRLETSGRGEIAALVETFNDMLARPGGRTPRRYSPGCGRAGGRTPAGRHRIA